MIKTTGYENEENKTDVYRDIEFLTGYGMPNG
jgi:hypothetical protein